MSGPYLFCKPSKSAPHLEVTTQMSWHTFISLSLAIRCRFENNCSLNEHYVVILLSRWPLIKHKARQCNIQTLIIFHCIHLCNFYFCKSSSFHACNHISSIHSCALFITLIPSITFLCFIHLCCTIHCMREMYVLNIMLVIHQQRMVDAAYY